MKRFVICALCVLTAAPVLGAAQVYRCPGVDGVPVFQHWACDNNGDVLDILNQRPAAGVGLRASEKAWLKARESRPAVRSSNANKRTRKQSKSQQQRCWKHRQQLQDVRRQLRAGYKATEGPGLKQKRERHRQYLENYCD